MSSGAVKKALLDSGLRFTGSAGEPEHAQPGEPGEPVWHPGCFIGCQDTNCVAGTCQASICNGYECMNNCNSGACFITHCTVSSQYSSSAA